MSLEQLFLWSSPSPGFSVNSLCNYGPRRIVCCLTNGKTSRLVAVDPHTAQQTSQYEFPSGSGIVNIAGMEKNNQVLTFGGDGSLWSFDLRVFNEPQIIITSKGTKQLHECGAGAVTNDGYTVAMGTTDSNIVRKENSKKGRLDRSPSDSNSEPFTHFIEIWDLRNTGMLMHSYSECHSDSVQALSFSNEDSRLLISGGADGLVNILDVSFRNEDDALQSSNQLGSSVNNVNFLSSSRAYATSDDNRFEIYCMNKANDVDVIFKKNAVSENFLVDILDVDDDRVCALLSTATGAATLRFYSNKGKEISEPEKFNSHEDLIRCATYTGADRLLITGDESGIVTGRELRPFSSTPRTIISQKIKKKKKPYDR